MVISFDIGRSGMLLLLLLLLYWSGRFDRINFERAQLANLDRFDVLCCCFSQSGTGEFLGTRTVAPFFWLIMGWRTCTLASCSN